MRTLLNSLFAYSLNRKPTLRFFLVVAWKPYLPRRPSLLPEASAPLSPFPLSPLKTRPFRSEEGTPLVGVTITQIADDVLTSDLTGAGLAGALLFTTFETHSDLPYY